VGDLAVGDRGWHCNWIEKGASDVLLYSGDVEGKDCPALFRKACRVGAEGIISKRH
jgi:hypothetical protein